MKPFRYSLQALLALRQRGEQHALELHAQALMGRQLALDQLHAVRRVQEESWSRWRMEAGQPCTASVLIQWDLGNRTLSEREQSAEAAVRRSVVAVDQSLRKLLVARRDRQAVDNHMEKQRLAYKSEISRQEQKASDDLAQRRVPWAMVSESATEAIA